MIHSWATYDVGMWRQLLLNYVIQPQQLLAETCLKGRLKVSTVDYCWKHYVLFRNSDDRRLYDYYYAFSLWIVLQRRLSMKWKAKRRLFLLAFAEWRISVAAILLRVSNRKELALKWVTFIVLSVTPMSNNWSCDLRVSAVKESQWLFFVWHLETGGGRVTIIIEWYWIREINDDDNQTKSVTWLDVLNRYVEYSESLSQ